MLKKAFVSLLISTAVALGTASPVYAAEGGGEASGGGSNKTLDLSNMVLPVEMDGKLVNYLFVSVVITVNDGFDHWQLRENAHVIRDHILKEAHRHTVGLDDRPMELDRNKLEAVLHTVFDKDVGEGSIKSIEILASDSQKIFVDG